MTHVCEEFGLRTAGGFGLLLGVPQGAFCLVSLGEIDTHSEYFNAAIAGGEAYPGKLNPPLLTGQGYKFPLGPTDLL